MVIQWFPGHVNKTEKVIAERTKSISMIIKMLDAQMPASSENPLLAQLSRGEPKLRIFNKQDLANLERTKIWLGYYNSRPDTRAITFDSSETGSHGKITQACRAMIPHHRGIGEPLHVPICDIPNAGKSTPINDMIGKKSAKTGNKPGITKAEQRLFLADDFWLYDTPGILWPKIIVEEGGCNLVAGGAVGHNALDEEEVTLELLDYPRHHYLPMLQERCQADKDPSNHWDDNSRLERVAKKRGVVLSGGRVNYQRTTENILTDFREGKTGGITLETLNQWKAWLKKARQKEAEFETVRKARKTGRKGQKSSESM